MKSGVLASFVYWGLAQKEEVSHRRRVEDIIDFLKIQDLRRRPTGSLAYGLQKRVELGRALALDPKILLLDEPMGGMNQEEKEDMARFILDVNEEWGTTVILIEHDMGVVMDISMRVTVLDMGQKIAEGTPDEVRANPAVIKAYLGDTKDAEVVVAESMTLPRLLQRNAREIPDRPAMREKDRGIWQTSDLAPVSRPGARPRPRPGCPRLQPWRAALGDRRQSAAALLGPGRGPVSGRRAGTGVPGLDHPRAGLRPGITPRWRWSWPRTRSRWTRCWPFVISSPTSAPGHLRRCARHGALPPRVDEILRRGPGARS